MHVAPVRCMALLPTPSRLTTSSTFELPSIGGDMVDDLIDHRYVLVSFGQPAAQEALDDGDHPGFAPRLTRASVIKS